MGPVVVLDIAAHHAMVGVGGLPGSVSRGRPLTGQPHRLDVPPGLPSSLLERRPDIQRAEQALVSVNAQIGVARANYFPQIDLTGSGGFESTALASLLSGRPVRHTVGMTGEVTLQGRVLPIGGLKQKVLAAHAAGLTDVILPERNRGDLDDVPADVREQMTFHPVMSIGEVLEVALEPQAADLGVAA